MSNKKYNPQEIESKWRKVWEEENLYQTPDLTANSQKRYVLDMFPYPSGAGMHVGHMLGYVATDVYSRFSRMQGYSVMHPMGWDAFGLPAENYAVKTQTPPAISTEENIASFKKQIEGLSLSYDWSKELNSSHPDYYKWTQWLFIQFWKQGLVYKKKASVNWCPKDQTVLANEQVIDGKCERCDSEVVQKELEQWFMAITKYADQLLEGLDRIDWPASTKAAQRNWIGRKEGMFIKHHVVDMDLTFETFTAYPAWSFADTYIVLAPEHPLALELSKGTGQEQPVRDFLEEVSHITHEERLADKLEKKGVFTGRFAHDPFGGEDMPIWIANFALMDFGTGIIRCSGHDPRDVAFAQKYGIKIKEIVDRIDPSEPINAHTNRGILKNSGLFTGRDVGEVLEEMVDWIEAQNIGRRTVTYHLRDWLISRQRYWGAPIPMVYCEKDGWQPVPEDHLPVLLPTDVDFQPTGESPINRSREFQKDVFCSICSGPARREVDTMDTFVDSSWYFLRFCDPQNTSLPFEKEKVDEWMPVDLYIGGDHATTHLIFARFWMKALKDMGMVSADEPFARFFRNGYILGEDHRKMSKRWGNVINPLDIIGKYGADTLRLYEMFMSPLEETRAWSMSGIEGANRFLSRVYTLFTTREIVSGAVSPTGLHQMHTTIAKVTEDIEALKFNTAVSSMMKWYNFLFDQETITAEERDTFLKLLAPFAPHITEELFQIINTQLPITNDEAKVALSFETPRNDTETVHGRGSMVNGKQNDTFESIHQQPWPVSDKKYLVRESVTIVFQVNGKVRGQVVINDQPRSDRGQQSLIQDEVEKIVRETEAFARWTEGKEIKKVIFVPGKIINFVV